MIGIGLVIREIAFEMLLSVSSWRIQDCVLVIAIY